MKVYGGIDLHANNNYTLLLDEQDRVLYRKRLPNGLSVVLAELVGLVVELTYNWYWLVDGLWQPATGSIWPTRLRSGSMPG